MKPQTIDKALVAERFNRCLATYDAQATVQYDMAERLVALVSKHCGRSFRTVFDIGFGTGLFARQMARTLDIQMLWANDIAPDSVMNLFNLGPVAPHMACMSIPGDIEAAPKLPENLSMIASNATFQWIEDLPRLLKRLVSHLSPDGVLAFGTFGPDNMAELRDITGMSLRYHDADSLRAMIPPAMEVLSVQEYKTILRFASPGDVLDHIRATGSNALVRAAWSPATLARFERKYMESFAFKGGVRLTYHPILVVARKARKQH